MKQPIRSLGSQASNSKKKVGTSFPIGVNQGSESATPSPSHVIASAGGSRTTKPILAQQPMQMSDRVAANRNSVTLSQSHPQQQKHLAKATAADKKKS